MKISPKPENEAERLRAIQRFQILDTPAEKDFDDIVELASQICNCPISLITIIFEERQWFKAKMGLSISETTRDVAFCAHTIHNDDLMIIPDATKDERFCDNPMVTGSDKIRFYAGMPLITSDGYKLGSLCVIDKKPKNLTPEQLKALRILGKQVVNLLNLRMSILQLNTLTKEKNAGINEVFDRISDGFATIDKEWIYTYVNKKAAKILKRPNGYLEGKHIFTEFPEAVGQPFHKACQKVMKGGKYMSLVEYDTENDLWLENHLYPSPIGISIYVRDITEKKKSDISLLESEEKYRSLVEHASDGIFITSDQGEYLDVNTNGCKLLGYSKQEMMNLRMQDLVGVDLDEVPPRFDELKAGKSILSTRKLRRKDGSLVFVEISSKMLPDGRLLGIVRDISNRLEAEQNLVREKELSDQVINSLPGVFYLSDQTPKLIRWNKKLENISGYSSKELAKMAPITLFDPDDHTGIKKNLENVYKNGFGTSEATMLSKSGEKTLFFFTGVKIEYEGKPSILGTGIDISKSKKREEELRENRRFLQSIVKNLPGYFYRVKNDKDYTPEYISGGVTKITGYEVDEYLVSRTITCGGEIIEEDKARVWNETQAAIGATLPYELNYRLQTKKGGIKWVWERGNGVWNDKMELIALEGFVTDITERKRIELELAAKESRLRTIFTTEPECIKLLDKRGVLLEMNPAGLAMIEADSEEQVKGKIIDNLVDEPYRAAFSGLTKDVFDGKSGRLEFKLIGLKGTPRWLKTHAVPLRDGSGKIISLLAVTIDITERKLAEKSLIDAEERYRNIFDKATEGIYQSTPEGKFITANSSLAKMFGYDSVEELMASLSNIGKQLYADPSERKRIIGLLNKQDRVDGFEMRAFKKNQDLIWVRDNIHAIRDKNGNIAYLEGTMEDITDRKIAEEKLEAQFKELQKTNYELDHFVYSVSHDLRAPLASILGLINVSELEDPNPLQKKYLDLIRGSVTRLDGFIHDILDYSRNTRLPSIKEKVDFHELISEVRNNLEQVSGMERLKIDLKIQNSIPHYSDPMRIGIILSNLLSNAIKYQDNSKNASKLLIRIKTTPEESTIVFKDNGVGIDKEHLSNVFDMFFRASSLSKGSGLGLYITRETISKLGGSISVDSEFGKFTSFKATLPNLMKK